MSSRRSATATIPSTLHRTLGHADPQDKLAIYGSRNFLQRCAYFKHDVLVLNPETHKISTQMERLRMKDVDQIFKQASLRQMSPAEHAVHILSVDLLNQLRNAGLDLTEVLNWAMNENQRMSREIAASRAQKSGPSTDKSISADAWTLSRFGRNFTPRQLIAKLQDIAKRKDYLELLRGILEQAEKTNGRDPRGLIRFRSRRTKAEILAVREQDTTTTATGW